MVSRFKNKRGRPSKADYSKIDYGTKELKQKRRLSLTDDVISICLNQGFISKTDYWSGIWFRFLYTLKYGNPNVTAYNIAYIKGINIDRQDPKWLAKQEKKYSYIIQELSRISAKKIVIDVCIFDIKPGFLEFADLGKDYNKKFSQLMKLQEGLELIGKIYHSYLLNLK